MEFKIPKEKKSASSEKKKIPFPLKSTDDIVGVFNGQFVMICDLDSMHYLYESGNFGKGNLSKGEPNYHSKKDDIPKIMLQHQFENQIKWNASNNYSHLPKHSESVSSNIKLSLQTVSEFLQCSFNNDEQNLWKLFRKNCTQQSENLNKKHELHLLEFKKEIDYKDENFRNFVNNILQLRHIRVPKPLNFTLDDIIILSNSFNPCGTDSPSACYNARLEKLAFGPEENLNLNLEESFFLKSEVGCLNIVDLNFSEIQIPDLWKKFKVIDENFTEKYITYQYFRVRGWIVRSGLKFGGDYLLYKDGPAYYHANYLVKVLDKRKKLTWREFIALNRLVETFNKDLLLSNVLTAGTVPCNESFPAVLENHSVQEVLVRRWFPTKERLSKGDKSSS